MDLQSEILENWESDIPGYVQRIASLNLEEYLAWTLSDDDGYGVVIIYNGDDQINESFSSVRLISKELLFEDGKVKNALILRSKNQRIKDSFSNLCSAFVSPGEEGNNREKIINSPIDWWKEWKELLGNKDIDEKVYDILGELCAFKYALQTRHDSNWNGPDGATYDIETQEGFIEVKSTVRRYRKEIDISSQFQLFPPDKPLDLILCVFEPTNVSGCSIDGILNEISNTGYDTEILNQKLEKKGFEKGKSIRKKSFILHEMLLYTIDESFPRITPSSFLDGVFPEGITKITYTVDLSGLIPKSLL